MKAMFDTYKRELRGTAETLIGTLIFYVKTINVSYYCGVCSEVKLVYPCKKLHADTRNYYYPVQYEVLYCRFHK